jgi:cytochrome b pre-mRNA-processing protein 3
MFCDWADTPMTMFSSLRRMLSGANLAVLPGQALYNAVVDEARRTVWYLAGEVPDTMDGRFDMVALVLSLVLLRLEAEPGDAAKQLCADLADRFIVDMDGSLRQEGIGDQVVGKHIGRMMAALGGRLGAYRDAGANATTYDAGDDAALAVALRRNLWRGEPVNDDAVAWVVAEARLLAAGLAAAPYARIAAGALA